MNTSTSQHNTGFVLAFALLLSSVVLALAFGIFNILLKELVLTSSARDSQIAFYAADSGVECALYWDTHSEIGKDAQGSFATSSFSVASNGSTFRSGNINTTTGAPIPKSPDAVRCMGANVTNITIATTGTSATTGFTATLNNNPNVCSIIKIIKTPGQSIETTIQSYGYNRCDLDNTSTRKVERAIVVTY